MALITPTDVLRLAPFGAISPAEIPGDDPGTISDVAQSGASTGKVLAAGFPADALSIWAKCVVPGDLGVAQFRVSKNGGVTYGSAVLTQAAAQEYQTVPFVAQGEWRFEVPLTGVVLRFQNGSGTPNSFLMDEIYSLTTGASQRMLEHCAAASDEYVEWAQNSDDNPRLDAPNSLHKVHMANVVRWRTSLGRGLDELSFKAQMEAYKQGVAYFQRRSEGTLRAEGVKDTIRFPLFVPALPDPLTPPI